MLPPLPSTFPEHIFQEFRQCAAKLFPTSDQAENSPERTQFVLSSLAAGYRYRTCVECNEEFRVLVINAPEMWREWNHDPEHAYKVERCLYTFLMSAVSVFESLAFCLYFVGSRISLKNFADIQKPHRINLNSASKSYAAAFPQELITVELAALPQKPEFKTIDSARNLLAHRVSGMRSMHRSSIRELNGSVTHKKKEVWYVPEKVELKFDEDLLQGQLHWVSSMLATLLRASRDFVIRIKP